MDGIIIDDLIKEFGIKLYEVGGNSAIRVKPVVSNTINEERFVSKLMNDVSVELANSFVAAALEDNAIELIEVFRRNLYGSGEGNNALFKKCIKEAVFEYIFDEFESCHEPGDSESYNEIAADENAYLNRMELSK